MTYKEFFKDKKIAVVGLGPHLEMIADIKFLLKNGADVTIYDMRSETDCRHGLAELIDVGLTKYFFSISSNIPSRTKAKHVMNIAIDSTTKNASDAKHISDAKDEYVKVNEPIDHGLSSDLAAVDLIILSPDMPLDASFLAKARVANVRIEYPQTLFLKLAPPITLIGVLGSCGKTTVSHMIFAILKKAFESYEDQGVYYIDPETPSALSYLKKSKKGDLVVARITKSLIPAYEEARVSPHIAVFTTLSSKQNYPGARAPSSTIFNMLEFQTYNNFIIGNDDVIDQIRENPVIEPKAKMLRTGAGIVPIDWKIRYRGGYDRENAALALRTAELFKIPLETSKEVLESWKGLKGRLELVKKVGGVEFYNDTAACSPVATLAALRSISVNKNIVLIFGGATTGDSYTELIENIPQYVSTVILLPGSGTMGVRRSVSTIAGVSVHFAHAIEDAVVFARDKAGKGDRVLFSPGFDACGVEKSWMERGDKFVKAVRGL